MFSFIRKRLPSKDRNDEHLKHTKNDESIPRSQSIDDLHVKQDDKPKSKRKKKATLKSSSTVEDLTVSPPINRPYSDVDYFPMMPGALSQSITDEKTSEDAYYYLDPVEDIRDLSQNHRHGRVHHIPVSDCRSQTRQNSVQQRTPTQLERSHERSRNRSLSSHTHTRSSRLEETSLSLI